MEKALQSEQMINNDSGSVKTEHAGFLELIFNTTDGIRIILKAGISFNHSVTRIH